MNGLAGGAMKSSLVLPDYESGLFFPTFVVHDVMQLNVVGKMVVEFRPRLWVLRFILRPQQLDHS